MRPEIYTAKWLTTEQHDVALASRILVGEETFHRAKLKQESSGPEV